MNFFGLSFDKLLPILLLAVIVLGPSKLPYYAEKLRDGIKAMRGYATSAKTRMKEEMGPEFDGIDWQKMDPRKYDPRRIVRDAFQEEKPKATPSPTQTSSRIPPAIRRLDNPAPFDTEAT